jgi:hypothetical protein
MFGILLNFLAKWEAHDITGESMRRLSIVLSAVAVALPASARESNPDEPPQKPAGAAFREHVQPLLANYCLGCHSGEKPKARLDLAAFGDEVAVLRSRKVWTKVRENVESGVMPPPDKPQPSPDEVVRFTRWLETTFSTADCRLEKDPAPVTMRRLNRAEYVNTIRDLLGVTVDAAKDFPSDDVGYGFDNIGDVLTVSPLLLEKYLAAAEQVAEKAIVTDRIDRGPVKGWETEKLGDDAGGSKYEETGRILASEGEIATQYDAPRDAEYIFRARASGQQAGPDPVRMEFRVEGKGVGTVDVTAKDDSPELYEVRAALAAGQRRISVAFVNDYYKPDDPDPNHRDRNLIVDAIEVQGPIASEPLPLPESHTRVIFRAPKGDDMAVCAREILTRFATRAFRRPATPAEVDRLVGLVEMAVKDGESFSKGIQLAVEAVLVSPHFLFRVERGRNPEARDATQPLADNELASRLSYFLWSSMPDDELFQLASENRLHDDAVLEAQARRMLKDPKSSALIENFAGQWLQLRNLKAVSPSRRRFPAFDEALRVAMGRETQLFVEAVVREDRNVVDFLDADFTFLNERLAHHYGIPGVTGDEFRRVTLSGDQRGGLLTQASILTVTSNPTRTSPVKRGKWILEQILGTPPPPPPPNVPELKDDRKTAKSASLRERMEQHRANPSCASCHSRMDPLGFGLENYDAVGAWREQDGTFPIDPSGTLPSGRSFRGPRELKGILKEKQKDFVHCLSEKMLIYALGRGLEAGDACVVDRIGEGMAADQNRFSRLVVEIVKSTPFRVRKGEGKDS